MDLGFLTPLYDRTGPWATVYTTTATGTEDAAARQELLAREAGERLAEQGADDRTRRAVHEALRTPPDGPHPAGRALFATGGEVVLDRPLSTAPPFDADVSWSPLPHVAPLLDLAVTEPSCLLARVNRTGADFELRSPLSTRDAGGAEGDDWPIHRTGTADWSERHFQNAVENTWEQNAAAIAEAVFEAQRRTGAELVVIAGEQRECLAVRDRLPEKLHDHTVVAEHGTRGPGTNEAAGEERLDQELEEIRTAYVRRRTAEALDRFRAGRHQGDGGRVDAAEGVPALVEAAQEHRIAQLLVRPDGPDLGREVWVGQDPDQIALRRTDAKALGDSEPFAARADDALLRVAAVTGAEALSVQPLTDPRGTGANVPDEPSGGFGALLRWPAA
ncbi:Vms1/Ankzf1 family peptidyl-tRNA hydrolase [Streptomyces sp. TRM70308]|uniref:baeRF2 domain-containing protein n=1 Tax=Streptomyces sp. TRM70308 TaxID=3131932 RepID=UPI003CFDE217